MESTVEKYRADVMQAWELFPIAEFTEFSQMLKEAYENQRNVFICGNGGSSANAVHIANDLTVCADPEKQKGLRVQCLNSNGAIVAALANDTDYKYVFSKQLRVQANAGDILVVLSGSGNSPNILEALEAAKDLNLKSVAILGFDGGKSLQMADLPLHIKSNDMQVCEDFQLSIGHMVMKQLNKWITQG